MSYILHQQNIPQAYLEQLSQSSPSYKYRNSTTVPKLGFWDKVKIFFSLDKQYEQLKNFYPHHPVIATSAQIFKEDCSNAVYEGLLTSAILVLTMHQFARRGKVLPLLSKHGKFLKTHRIFRQYIWAWILPTTIFYTLAELNHFDNVCQLVGVHARRLQKGILTDPAGSIYPKDLLHKSMAGVFKTSYINLIDLAQKVQSQGELRSVQSYANPDFEAVDIGEAGQAGQEEEQ